MAKRKGFDPLARLQARNNVTTAQLRRDLKRSLGHVQGAVARASNPALAASQARLYNDIYRTYGELGRSVDRHLKHDVIGAASDAAHKAQDDMPDTRLVRFDKARLKRYYRYVAPSNGRSLAAVFTDKMADSTVNALRQGVIETERQAAIEGWTMNQKQKALQDRWSELARDDSAFKFVDRSGKRWENAQYLQMLTRTTAQRVYNDAYVDRIAESGIKLVRIGSLGAPDCPICKAWQGVICTIAGRSPKYPTLAEAKAAGVFHPNCLCTQEAVDEELDAEDIEVQAKQGKVDFNNAEAMQKRSDAIKVDTFRAQGMTEEDALDALTRSKVEEAIRTGTFSEDSVDLAAGFDHEQLVDFREHGVPVFRLQKKGDELGYDKEARVVTVDRSSVKADIEADMGVKAKKPEELVYKPSVAARDAATAKASALASEVSSLASKAAQGVQAIEDALTRIQSYTAAFQEVDFGTIEGDAKADADNARNALHAVQLASSNAKATPDKIAAVALPATAKAQATYDSAVADLASRCEQYKSDAEQGLATIDSIVPKMASRAGRASGRAIAWGQGIWNAAQAAAKKAQALLSSMEKKTRTYNTTINALLRKAGLKK